MTLNVLNLTGTFLGARPTASLDPPTITSPADNAESNSYTPTLTWTAVSGFAGTYQREVRATLNGTPTATGITGTSSVLDELIENISEYQARVRAGASGTWSTPITLKVHVSDFRDTSSDAQAAPITTHNADITGGIVVTSTPASVSRAAGKTHIAVASSGLSAYVWTNAAFARAHNRLWMSQVTTDEQDSRCGLHGSQLTTPQWNAFELSAKVGLQGSLNDNGTTVILSSHNSNGFISDRRAFIAFPEGGGAYFWHATDDLVWHFGGMTHKGTTTPLYLCLGGISLTSDTMDIDEGDVLVITSGTFSEAFDWATTYTTAPVLDTAYTGVANGWSEWRFTIPASGSIRFGYRRFDDTSYRYLEYSGGTVVAKMRVAGVDTAYSTPISFSSVGSVGDSISIYVSMYGNREYYGVYNHTTGVYITPLNQTSNQTFNNTSTEIYITSTVSPVLTSLIAVANTDDRFAVLDLAAATQTSYFFEVSASQIQRTFVDTATAPDEQHVIIGYRNGKPTTDPMDMFDVNLTQETVLHKLSSLGRSSDSFNLIWDDASNYIYGWTSDSTYFWRWAFGGNIQTIAPSPALLTGAYFYKGVLSANGKAYIGVYGTTNGASRLYVYDPATVTLTSLGSPSGGSFAAEWAYFIEASNDYVFMTMGQSPWYLTIYNISSTVFTSYYSGENVSSGSVRCNIARTIFYFNKVVSGVTTWYDITDGTPGVVSAPSEATLQPIANIGGTIPVPAQTDVTWDLLEMGAYTGHDPVIGWTRSGESAQTATLTGINLYPSDLKLIIDYSATELLVMTAYYGPVVIYNKSTGIKTVPGVPPYSIYGVQKVGTKFQFTGYPSLGLLEWDPSLPWTLNAGSGDPTITNPSRKFTAGTHGYYITTGSDGKSYVASEYERDSVGGELTQYNNSTEAVVRLRTALGNETDGWNPRGLAAVGTRIIYSGIGVGPVYQGDDAKLFVCTVAAFPTIENEWTIAGKTDLGFITAVSSTDVVGLVPGSSFCYRMNIITGSVVWSATLTGTIFSGGSWYAFHPFWDGTKIWFGMDDAIYSFNPSVDPDTTAPVLLADVGYPVNVHIVDGIAHTYNGTIKYEYVV